MSWTAAVGAIGGALGSSGLGSAIASGIAAKHQQKRQFKENKKARQWQHDERIDAQNWQAEQAEIDRNWQHDESQIARDWNSAEADKARDWELEQWNRNNEYNDPAAQRDRLLAAGFNPLGNVGAGESVALNTQPAASVAAPSGAMPAGVSDPSVSVPQVNNPMGEALDAFLKFQQLELASKKTDAEIRKLDSDSEKNFELSKTERALRDGRVDFLGVQIDLGKAQMAKTKEDTRAVAQQMRESEARIEQIFQWCDESHSRIRLQDYNRLCAERKLPLELKKLGQEILLTNQRAITEKQLRPYRKSSMYEDFMAKKKQNTMTQRYIDSGFFEKDMESEANEKYFRSEKERLTTKSEALYNWDKSWDSIGKATSVIADILKSAAFLSFGRNFKMPTSTENPLPSQNDVMMHDSYIP